MKASSLLLIVYEFIIFKLASSASLTDISRLRQYLLSGYDKSARPIQNNMNATSLTMYPFLRAFEFDEERSIFSVHGYAIMRWTDDHFKWNPAQYGNLSKVYFAPEEVWQPDLIATNSFGESGVLNFGSKPVVAYSTGVVWWFPPTRFQVRCDENMHNWPYDTQSCHIYISTWTHHGGWIDLKIPENKTEFPYREVVQNKEFELLSTEIKLDSYPYGDDSYQYITVSVNIKRRYGTHNCAFMMPALAISCFILTSFWIMPGTPERLALILAAILVNVIYLYEIYEKILTHGDRVPLILQFYQDSLIMVSIALVWTICIRHLATTKRATRVPLPGALEKFITSLPAQILCIAPRPAVNELQVIKKEQRRCLDSKNLYQEDWAWLANLLDRLAFLLYTIIYAVFYFSFL